MVREDEVRCIAYNIWQAEGCPGGCDYEHWFKAESIWDEQQQSIAGQNKSPSKRTAKPQARVSAARKKSKKTSP